MFSQVSVILSTGGMHGKKACMVKGGMCGNGGACVAMMGTHGKGHAWQGGVHGRECVWQGGGVHGTKVCMVKGGMNDEGSVCVAKGACVAKEGACIVKGPCVAGACVAGACMAEGMRGRRDGHCSGRYASYWNAFLFSFNFKFSN